ncbi:MAG TPA: phage portal protein [Cellvibrio sp.]|nr:phage portal protein [Cellvibrio sp.]
MKFFAPLTNYLGGIWTVIWGGSTQAAKTRNHEQSDSGECISAETILQFSTAWRCCQIISQTTAMLPRKLYRKDADGKRVEVNDELSIVICKRPNSMMSGRKFWEMMLMCVCLWGNAYAKILRVGGRVVGLEPLLPGCMTVVIDGKKLKYVYTENGNQVEYQQNEIFHLKGLTVDGIVGLSPISYAKQAMGLAIAADKAASGAFKNGMRPSGVLEMSNFLTEKQREDVRKNIVEPFSGVMGTGKTMVLEGGMKFGQVSFNPIDAELLGTRKFQQETIAGWYGVPAWLAGISNSGTSNFGTGLEQQNLGFLTYTLSSYIDEIESAIDNQLLTPEQRSKNIYLEHSLEGLLRADSAGRAAYYSTMTQNGIMTRNEGRIKENLEPKPGGDVLTVQSNLVPLDQLGKTNTPTQALKDSLRAFLKEDEAA